MSSLLTLMCGVAHTHKKSKIVICGGVIEVRGADGVGTGGTTTHENPGCDEDPHVILNIPTLFTCNVWKRMKHR